MGYPENLNIIYNMDLVEKSEFKMAKTHLPPHLPTSHWLSSKMGSVFASQNTFNPTYKTKEMPGIKLGIKETLPEARRESLVPPFSPYSRPAVATRAGDGPMERDSRGTPDTSMLWGSGNPPPSNQTLSSTIKCPNKYFRHKEEATALLPWELLENVLWIALRS